MPAQHQKIQQRLKAFDFAGLFTQELMWNHFPTRPLEVPVDGTNYTLTPVAQRGMAVFECVPPTDAQFPKYAVRRKIDTQVSKAAREHIIIFHDLAKTVQVWQWVRREGGKQSACREQLFYTGQSGDALIQKIQSIAFGLDDEANITETVVRVGAAFDVEKVTKQFYELFKKEHDAFLKFTLGIPDDRLQRWYASVMLNRLMFIYFIQKKAFLTGDQHYLTNKLAESKRRGRDKFYRDFLCPLFFEGFAKREEQRTSETNLLLGRVPYLNGGLFLKHQIEDLHGKHIEVPDKAFERIFGFFEQYDWHLDDRPTRTGREINPDVLGYVFEKYINQKDMGAYYTKEDITEYIGESTIIPALFDMAQKSCRIAFEGEHSVWRLLQKDPDRYINAAMLKGVNKELPKQVANGLKDVFQRGDWNRTADWDYKLPTETWREVVARRKHYEEARKKLAAGEIRSINDLITENLDIRRFAEEVIANCEGPELLRAFYKAIRNISILDPACGSGAFLFAALNVLERLYDTCLVRMQAFVDDLDRSGEKHSPEKFSDFRKTLAEMNDKARHPSPRYFILKSIVLNNLYGVDIMEEATEICKLRLFLKLVAQLDAGEKIEPLPDIDFNIRAGNTLVGFSTTAEVSTAVGSKLDFENKMQEINERAGQAELAYDRFRQMQVEYGHSSGDFAAAKAEVQKRLAALRAELDSYLSGEYGIRKDARVALETWQRTHQPFHWFVEFFAIMKSGGFDVVIGNPPYVERRVIQDQYSIRNYKTDSTNNLYAYMSERGLALLKSGFRFGFIIPLSSMSTDKFDSLQKVFLAQDSVWLSNFDDRPARLFEGLEHIQLTIVLCQRKLKNDPEQLFVTRCMKWSAVERENLFATLRYARLPRHKYLDSSTPKVDTSTELEILSKLWSQLRTLGSSAITRGNNVVYYTRKVHAFLNVLDFVPEIRTGSGRRRDPSEQKTVEFRTAAEAHAALCVLNSSMFRWFVTVFSDCRNLNRREGTELSDRPEWLSESGGGPSVQTGGGAFGASTGDIRSSCNEVRR